MFIVPPTLKRTCYKWTLPAQPSVNPALPASQTHVWYNNHSIINIFIDDVGQVPENEFRHICMDFAYEYYQIWSRRLQVYV